MPRHFIFIYDEAIVAEQLFWGRIHCAGGFYVLIPKWTALRSAVRFKISRWQGTGYFMRLSDNPWLKSCNLPLSFEGLMWFVDLVSSSSWNKRKRLQPEWADCPWALSCGPSPGWCVVALSWNEFSRRRENYFERWRMLKRSALHPSRGDFSKQTHLCLWMMCWLPVLRLWRVHRCLFLKECAHQRADTGYGCIGSWPFICLFSVIFVFVLWLTMVSRLVDLGWPTCWPWLVDFNHGWTLRITRTLENSGERGIKAIRKPRRKQCF